MKEKYLAVLLFITLGVLLIPFVQYYLPFIQEEPLFGYYKKNNKGKLTFENWWDGSFQADQEKFLMDTFPCRKSIIRLSNQVDYSVFNKARAYSVVVGKDNYLYEDGYIKANYGDKFLGENVLRSKSIELSKLRDTLGKIGIQLMLVISPSKASYYPEYIPDSYKSKPGSPTNYGHCKRLWDSLAIPYIDFNEYFVGQKSKTKYPLFPKYGTHWSYYGACLAADSVIRYVEKSTNKKLPRLVWDTIVVSNQSESTDDDISIGLNLLNKPSDFQLAYPRARFDTLNKQKLKVLVVGDSFYNNFMYLGLSDTAFNNSEFWYYNREIVEKNLTKKTSMNGMDRRKHLERHQLVIIECSVPNLSTIPWDFTDSLLRYYSKGQTR